MRVGYGRGYYGAAQRAPKPLRRGGSGWIKIAVVAGIGAAVWFMWPRSPKAPDESGGGDPKVPAPPSPPEGPIIQIAAHNPGPRLDQNTPSRDYPSQQAYEDARSRGYPSQQAYEDAVVASARQLQEAGAKVAFAPHLQHLTPRLGP